MSRVGFQEKLDPPLNISLDKFLHTIMRHDLNVYKEYFLCFFEAQNLGLCHHVETSWHDWDLGPHVDRP